VGTFNQLHSTWSRYYHVCPIQCFLESEHVRISGTFIG